MRGGEDASGGTVGAGEVAGEAGPKYHGVCRTRYGSDAAGARDIRTSAVVAIDRNFARWEADLLHAAKRNRVSRCDVDRVGPGEGVRSALQDGGGAVEFEVW